MINERLLGIFDIWGEKTNTSLDYIEVGHFALSDTLYITGIHAHSANEITCHIRELECIILENGAKIYKTSPLMKDIWLPINSLRRGTVANFVASFNDSLEALDEAYLLTLRITPYKYQGQNSATIEDYLYENKIDMCRHILELKKNVASLTNDIKRIQLNSTAPHLSDIDIATMAAL